MPSLDGLARTLRARSRQKDQPISPDPSADSTAAPIMEPSAVQPPANPIVSDPETSEQVTSFGDLHPKRKLITMIGVILAMLLAALDQTIVGTALPRIVRDLGGADHLTWVVTAYMLASTVTVPIYGKLSDLYGRKWFFFGGILIFLVGSILCGASQNMLQLIIFRAIQGIGGGAVMGNAFAIIGDLFAPAERARWQGIMGGIFGLASVIGPTLGGWLTDHASWHWVFYVNLPLGIVALSFIGFLMPKVVSTIQDKVIDYLGAGFLVATLVPFLLALSWGGREYAWSSATIITMLAGSVLALIGFIWAEHRAMHPIIPLNLFKNSIFTVSVAITFLTAAAMFGAIIYIPIFAQLVQGMSATNSGNILTPLMIGVVIASIASGQIIARTGKYRVLALVGTASLALSLLWLSRLGTNTTQMELLVRMIALGLGLGITMPIFTLAVQNAFQQSQIGVVTAATQLFRSVGSTVGTAIFGAFFNNALAAQVVGFSNSTYGQAAAAKGVDVSDPNIVQGLLSPEGQAAVHATLTALPATMQSVMTRAFADYIVEAKAALTAAIDHVFLIASLIAALALLLTLLLKEIPMQAHPGGKRKNTLREAGEELAVELGQAQDKDEPILEPTRHGKT